MKIAIDISPLQGPHRMRGIGSTIINFINNIPQHERERHQFVIYMYDEGMNTYGNPLNLLNLEGLEYEIRSAPISDEAVGTGPQKLLYRKLTWPFRALSHSFKLLEYYTGDSRLKTIGKVDVFLQFDQQQSLPRGFGVKKALVLYDIIPYILEWDYLWSYSTARQHGHSRKGSLNHHLHRLLYLYKLKINVKKADHLLAISDVPVAKNPTPVFKHYVATSWGYISRPYDLDVDKPYLLFVGGADKRRKLEDLITAFNHLRAQGEDLQLILAGDTMQGPENIPTLPIQNALKTSSYLDDIVFVGFVPDEVREVLYQHALAFVYPSLYEGFGLPILESMRYGTPVITYKNSSIPEVAGEAALYASDYESIMHAIQQLADSPSLREKYAKLGKAQSNKFTWPQTAENILTIISN
jgi:glycosyltransferase involved in cell wall biosynthesis